MDGLLTPVSTTYLKARPRKDDEDSGSLLQLRQQNARSKPVQPLPLSSTTIDSADEALEVLRSQPDYDTLQSVLTFLTRDPRHAQAFSIHAPGPKSAAVVRVLVTEIAPNYWTLLSEGSEEYIQGSNQGQSHDKDLFIRCLRSVTGINAILSHMRVLIQESTTGSNHSHPETSLYLGIFLALLASILKGDDAIRIIRELSTTRLSNEALKKAQSQALLALLTSGRLTSLTGEAVETLGRDQVSDGTKWISDGIEVSKWVGANITSWVKSAPEADQVQFCSLLFQRALSLGYSEQLMKFVIDELLLTPDHNPQVFKQICFNSTITTKKVLQFLLAHLSRKFIDGQAANNSTLGSVVSAVAGIINSVVDGDESRKALLVDWGTSSSGAGLGHQIGIRRAVLSVLAQDKEAIGAVFEKSLSQFGDELYIKHAAVLQQNVHAEILLLSAGYVSRLTPIKLAMTLRSGSYLSAISNRIASTQSQPRFLGMVVGECLSSLVDKSDKKLDFHLDDTEQDEANELKALSAVVDKIGPAAILLTARPTDNTKTMARPPKKRPKKAKPTPRSKSPIAAKAKPIIEEIGSSDDEDDDDLAPYAKISDPEDSDEDPTLVQRNKIRPPVYVRDLIAFLRDSENYDKQKLGLETAPVLIRRKANYGTEVSSHADELAGLLVGIQDKFEIEEFNELRLQSMVALMAAQPKTMAPWFARTFFEGDYSLSQRTTVLIALGVSARELGGFNKSEYEAGASFPSKTLPEKVEQLYISASGDQDRSPESRLKALPATALDTITKSLTSTFLEPIAAEAADANTGPDVFKLQTFTARYKSKSAKRPRVRAIPNTTAAIISGSFFYPLTAHFQMAMRSSKPLILNPALLGLYLQTLGVITHSTGPTTLSLPQLTSELWDLLLRVRQHVIGDMGGTKGWLVAMAALLAVNEGDMRRLCEAQGRQVVETREWVSAVFERTRGEDGGEENEVKMLAAGVLIRLGEAIESYQALLMGDMIGFA